MLNPRFVDETHTTISAEVGGTVIEFFAIPGLKHYDTLVVSGLPIAPPTAGDIDASKATQIDRLDLALLRIDFNHENRLRVLESKPEITMQQFKTALKAMLT